MKKITLKHTGQIGKYKFKRGQTILMDEDTIKKLNPNAYRIRPELPTRTTMDVPEPYKAAVVKRVIKRNGAWWTLYENGEKVKSARTKEELECL